MEIQLEDSRCNRREKSENSTINLLSAYKEKNSVNRQERKRKSSYLNVQILPADQSFNGAHLQGLQSIIHAKAVLSSVLDQGEGIYWSRSVTGTS